ncbi:hypothetical protein DSL92_08405 [Billgrantia gudaonensis]|uniref:Uncharacterized protein n=1 Tax=Billgrantia gudaonensis TaxID=376427 RepID=A0A432JID1_9GAMM|nr:hypothetical protein DSL92_08405 [Halomonas gudaonensis]
MRWLDEVASVREERDALQSEVEQARIDPDDTWLPWRSAVRSWPIRRSGGAGESQLERPSRSWTAGVTNWSSFSSVRRRPRRKPRHEVILHR